MQHKVLSLEEALYGLFTCKLGETDAIQKYANAITYALRLEPCGPPLAKKLSKLLVEEVMRQRPKGQQILLICKCNYGEEPDSFCSECGGAGHVYGYMG